MRRKKRSNAPLVISLVIGGLLFASVTVYGFARLADRIEKQRLADEEADRVRKEESSRKAKEFVNILSEAASRAGDSFGKYAKETTDK